jgi:rod shape-determining protein MreC
VYPMRQELSSKTQVGFTCLVLFLFSLFITAYSSRNPSIARVGNSLVQRVVAPISEAAYTLREGFRVGWGRYVFLVHTADENDTLRAQVADLQRELARAAEFNRENERLRGLLRVSGDSRINGIAARVIGGDSSGWVRGILVDQGESSGVREGMAVLHAQGLVGQVVAVSSNSARVLLVSDHASGIDVLHEESRARGVVEGAGEQVCELTFVTKDVQVKPGDAIITSGMDTVYPKGVLVGRISRVGQSAGALFQTIEVEPAVDFSKVEEVLIVSSGLERPAGSAVSSSHGVRP